MADHDGFLDQVVGVGLLTEARLLSREACTVYHDRDVVVAVEGRVVLCNSTPVTIRLAIDARFPHSLPLVYLNPWNALGTIPHVAEGDGFICYTESEGLVLNSENPTGLLEEATRRAIRVLENGLEGVNKRDFLDELGWYWQRLVSVRRPPLVIMSALEVTGRPRRVIEFCSKQGRVWVADTQGEVVAHGNGNPKAIDHLTQRSALYVPLTQLDLVQPPLVGAPWTTEYIRELVRTGLTAEASGALQDGLRQWRPKQEELVVLGFSRPSGGTVLVGLLFRRIQGSHPLAGGKCDEVPEPVVVRRKDCAYVLPRGGASLEFYGQRVLVIGCGAVGGYLAKSLPQLGVLNISLMDPDTLATENTFRHVLGQKGVMRSKVEMLKADIENAYPYVRVDAHPNRIEDAMRTGTITLQDFDLIVFALGNPTVELQMNKLLFQHRFSGTAVYAWLEPYGIGGHVLVTRPGKPGCLQCLYTPTTDRVASLYNRAAFSAPDQHFAKDDLGCGSAFTRYGGLDAQQTSLLALRTIADILDGSEIGNPLVSWKGRDTAFRSAGFEPSKRYLYFPQEKLDELRYGYINAKCPVCGGMQA